MTIKELKEKIATLPDNMEVFVSERKTEFAYGLVNSAYVKMIAFVDEPEGEVLAQGNVFVLDEE